jgi:hypothetical protein
MPAAGARVPHSCNSFNNLRATANPSCSWPRCSVIIAA